MLDLLLAAVGSLGVLVTSFSRQLRASPVTPPMLGLLLGVFLGPTVVGTVEIPVGSEIGVMHTASRLLLAVGVMAVALRYPVRDVRRRVRPVALLLALVMPLMTLTVAAGAAWILGVPVAIALALAAALAPTDPVLTAGLVTGEPAETFAQRLRELLSLESGANDGLALPFAVAAVALASGASWGGGFLEGLVEVAIGIVVGLAIGAGSGRLMIAVERHHDMEEGPRLFFTLVLAFAVLGITELVQGNAILAVFTSGIAFAAAVGAHDRRIEASIDEAMNDFLVLPLFTLLGVVLPWQGWADLGWTGVAFVVAVMTLRRLPWIALLARPLRLGRREAVWLGWFGPMGVAAIFYVGHFHESGLTDPVVWHAVTLVVVVSTFLHGTTAALARRSWS